MRSDSKPSKARVRRSFERAAPTYDSAAEIQRRICDRLLAHIPPLPVTCLLDAGCGTGYALPLLRQRFPHAHAIGLDLSPAMLSRIATPGSRIAGDLEHIPLAKRSLDLYWSSLAVQWCELPAALREALRLLRDGGALAVASLGPETFRELTQAFAGVDEYRHTLTFHTAEEVRTVATVTGFGQVEIMRWTEVAHYPDFKSLLRSVKAIGANQVGLGQRSGLMSRSTFHRAEAAYEAQRTSDGLPLTYDVITLHART